MWAKAIHPAERQVPMSQSEETYKENGSSNSW